jgi:hypothetical protein
MQLHTRLSLDPPEMTVSLNAVVKHHGHGCERSGNYQEVGQDKKMGDGGRTSPGGLASPKLETAQICC